MPVSDGKPIEINTFSERKAPPTPFKFNPRQEALLFLLDRHRRLPINQLIAWAGSERVRKEIVPLCNTNYVNVLEASKGKGSFSYGYVYALGTRGQRHVNYIKSRPATSTDFTKLNREFRPYNLRHEVITRTTPFAIESGLKELPRFELLIGDQVIDHMPREARKRYDPLRLHATVLEFGEPKEVSTRADEIIILRDHHATDRTRADKILFIEADTGMETISPDYAVFNANKIIFKYELYLAYARAKKYRDQFGVERMQVLFPTSGAPERIKHMIEVQKSLTADGTGSRRFLHTQTTHLLDADTNAATEPIWLDGTGNPTSVIV